jgi:HlyD family secretion protein
MNMLRRWWVWLGVALLVAAIGLGLNSWLNTNKEPDFKTTRIERGGITAAVAATGTLSPVVSVQVGSQVSGQLREIFADFNSEVKQGEVIARIDPETFEYKVRQAQADVDAARSQVMTQHANIAAQQAAVSMAEVNLAEAKRDLDRKQQLVEKGFISTAERDKAQATYNALIEQVKTVKAQAGVAIANARNAAAIVKQREAALAQARVDLERTAIKAPVNGIVIKRSVEKGQTVAASLQAPELFIIAENLTDMRVDASIDESEIGRVRLGQKASFTVDAFPGRNFEGAVKQIRKAAQNVSNVVTYTVVISASNPNKELLPGMTANVRIVTDSRDNVLKVANAALRYKPAGTQVPRTRAYAAQADSSNGTNGPGGQMRAMRERLEKELQLSDSQKAKLDTIFTGMRAKMMTSRDAPEGERQKLVERSRSEMRAQITGMLTPEQNMKYEEILAESGDRGGARMRGGRIYALDENKQPKLLDVRFGLTDGTSTEVISPEVREGMEIITGSTQSQQGRTSQRPGGPRMF